MCIALLSTAHPSYKLILIDNRDEFLNRPTAPAQWWPSPNADVLSGRDLLRPVRGTWLGLTRSGRIAVLTNYREDVSPAPSLVSRGALIKDFLTDQSARNTDAYVRDLIAEGKFGNVGGFSLVCGRMGEKLYVVSNRNVAEGDKTKVPEIMGDEVMTVGLSNAAFGAGSGWKKVEDGERLMATTIQESVAGNETEDHLISRFQELLSTDTLPRMHDLDGGLEAHTFDLQHTIFVPALGRKDPSTRPADEIAAARTAEMAEVLDANFAEKRQLGTSGIYATQKQTVVLVDHAGKVRFIERTLYDCESNPVPIGQGDVDITFQIED